MAATARSRPGWLVASAWVLMLAPLAWLGIEGLLGRWGVEPIAYLLDQTGRHAMWALLLALAVTPLRRWTGYAPLARIRRLVGLFAFFHACLHLLTWLWLDLLWDWQLVLDDLVHRSYITAGAGAWLILLALAATSTVAAQRRLGRYWRRLHRGVYLAGMLAILHHLWLTRADYLEPGIYAVILALLLIARVPALRPPKAGSVMGSHDRDPYRKRS
ncbi:MAG: sulfite oxidase heme-binding subunit YedZ [Halothiobacillaceae bacterium]